MPERSLFESAREHAKLVGHERQGSGVDFAAALVRLDRKLADLDGRFEGVSDAALVLSDAVVEIRAAVEGEARDA